MQNTKALVVLSGGQDSTTCLYWAKTHFMEVHTVSFDYGQRHRIELESAKRIAKLAKVTSHSCIDLKGILKSTSPLTSDAPLEQYENHAAMEKVIGDRVELTFVPMRNALFLTVAVNHALSLGIRDLVTGICQEDNANYPDCTEEFRNKFANATNEALGLATDNNSRLQIHAPLMFLSKAESVKLAYQMLGCRAALAFSHTSYDGKYPPVDNNHSNVLRAHGFEVANLPDPLVLRANREGLMDLPPTANYAHADINSAVGYDIMNAADEIDAL